MKKNKTFIKESKKQKIKKIRIEIKIANEKRTNVHLLGKRENKRKTRKKNQSATNHHTDDNTCCPKYKRT
jgi:hypothetical protein